MLPCSSYSVFTFSSLLKEKIHLPEMPFFLFFFFFEEVDYNLRCLWNNSEIVIFLSPGLAVDCTCL